MSQKLSVQAVSEVQVNKNMNEKVLELIKRRRLQTLMHSIIYYQFDESIISDAEWSRRAKELCDLQERFPLESKEAPLYDMFKDFNYSTGANLVYKADQTAINKAKYLITCKKGRKN